MTIDAWLAAAQEDARLRGLPELLPLLAGLATSTEALRSADEAQRAGTPADQSTTQKP